MPTIDDFLLNESSTFVLGAATENRTDLILTQLAAPTAGIHGTVTNSASGLAVDNAIVKLRTQSGDPVEHTETNPAGNYSIQGITPGTYTINVALFGFITSNGLTFTIQSGQSLNFNISITPNSRALNAISGIITNQSTGAPLVDATVILTPTVGTSESNNIAKSNADGEYMLTDIPDGEWQLLASAAGFYFSSQVPITISGGTIINIDIALQPDSLPQSTVNGFITQQSGTPIANACVGLYLINALGVEILQQITYSDSTGFYIFGRAAAGTYVVKAKSEKTV